MRKLITILMLMAMVFFAGNAFAIPTDINGNVIANTAGYHWVDAPYWTPTDLTTVSAGSNIFQIQIEYASYESDFGLFTVDDIDNPSTITGTFEIFDANDEPSFDFKSIFFKNENNDWYISSDNINYQLFDNVFGFYYGIHTGGAADPTVDYTYYSDSGFNTVNAGEQHVAVEWDGNHNVKIWLEDLINPDWDWKDMTVFGNDLRPTPEPATMFLLGSGLIGLATYRRKRIKK